MRMENMPEKYPARNGFSRRFGIIPHWVLRLKLPGSEYQTLHAITCHADKTRCARGWSVETLSAETGLARGNVQRAIRSLEEKGVLETTPGVGRGRSNTYRIVFDDPEASPGNSLTGEADLNGLTREAVSEKTASISDLNSLTREAPSTEDLQKERTPPSGETRAREGGEDFSNDEVDGRQGVLLLPLNGRDDRRSLLKKYNPSAALIDWAREQYGINALDDCVLSEFIDWHIEHNKLPSDIEAIEASYRRWLRRELRFAEQSRHRAKQRSAASEADDADVAVFCEAMRAQRAGAVQ
jgi:hypothetical protein